MKLAVSNIAWSPDEADAAYELLHERGVVGLEIAPGLLFPDHPAPREADREACEQALRHAADFGLEMCSMQSLLFGAEGAALFEDAASRERLQETVGAACALGQRLDLRNLVFGSPKNRVIPDGMTANQACKIWTNAFRAMGDIAAKCDTVLALEPNPEIYGTNFMTTLRETVDVVRQVDHPAVCVNLDLGAILSTGEIENLDEWLPDVMPLVSHVHLSVPWLKPLTTESRAIQRFVGAVGAAGWIGWVSIEMRSAFEALEETIDLCVSAIDGQS